MKNYMRKRNRLRDLFKRGINKQQKRQIPIWSLLLAVCLAISLISFASDSGINPAKRSTDRGSSQPVAKQWTDSLKDDTNESPEKSTNESVTESRKKSLKEVSGGPGAPALFGAAKGKNLIIVQVESLQAFPLFYKIGQQEVTPNLNRMARESLYFSNIYQQMGAGNTSDAEFMSNTSLYPSKNKPMSEAYGDRELPSLARLLKKSGYSSHTFHVNKVTFWNRDELYPALGFDHYYDKPYYSKKKFNKFGASDRELFRFGVEKLKELARTEKPFYAQFVTVSSHHPFKIPASERKLKLPQQIKKMQLGSYLQAVHYADSALGDFIQELKAAGVWDKSLVVVYGDHFGLRKNKNDPQKISAALGIAYHDHISRFNVPLIIHLPGQDEGQRMEQVGGQVDILPTVANLMGVSLETEGFKAFGKDLMNTNENVIGIRYYLPEGSFVNNEILYIKGKKGIADDKAYSLKTHQPIQDLTRYKNQSDTIIKWMKQSDAYVRSLPKRAESELPGRSEQHE